MSITQSSFAWDGLIAMDADKRNVGLDQIITYKGYIYGNYPIENGIVSITVSEQGTKKMILKMDVIPDSKSVKYFENTAWPFTFQVSTLSTEFSSETKYVVEARYDDKSTKLDFFIQPNPGPTCLEILDDNPIMVFTDKEKYDQGDNIHVSGCLSEATNKPINIIVYDPDGNKIGTSTITPNSDRTFAEDFVIDKRFGLNGTYLLEADADGLYSSTKSFVVPEFGSFAMIIFGISFIFILFHKTANRKFTNFIH